MVLNQLLRESNYPMIFNSFSEMPNVSPELVWWEDEQHHLWNPGDMILRSVKFNLAICLTINFECFLDLIFLFFRWDPYNLTSSRDADVTISLWGYKENSIEPGKSSLSLSFSLKLF
jgi:hypothetical protein